MPDDNKVFEVTNSVISACATLDSHEDRLTALAIAWIALAASTSGLALSFPRDFPLTRGRHLDMLVNLASLANDEEAGKKLERLVGARDWNGILSELRRQ